MKHKALIIMVTPILIVAGSRRVATAVEKPTTEMKTCVTAECHNTYQTQAVVHGPVAVGACTTCHQQENAAEHTYSLVRTGKELCAFCHLDQDTEKYVHKPLESGECNACHDPHASPNRYLLPTATIADLCRQCHDAAAAPQTVGSGETVTRTPSSLHIPWDAKYLHGPVAVGECSICHRSHGSDYPKLLTTATTNELCFSCHEVTHEELTKFQYVHEPVKENCTQCHNPHGAENAGLLPKPTQEMCFDCHEGVKHTVQSAAVKHKVMDNQTECTACHSPHASTVPKNLKADPKTLCMGCHDKAIKLDNGKFLANFKAEVDGKKYPHGPVSQNDCSACHISHGSDNFRLLVKPYPDKFYAPFDLKNYELCFQCHADSLVLNKRTDTLTDFRNGDWNLHYLHVNKSDRGRTCRACHATHASNLPKHIRETVPYGQWELPLKYTKTETGGACLPGCHAEKKYDRENPVEYDFMKPESESSDTPGTVAVRAKPASIVNTGQ